MLCFSRLAKSGLKKFSKKKKKRPSCSLCVYRIVFGLTCDRRVKLSQVGFVLVRDRTVLHLKTEHLCHALFEKNENKTKFDRFTYNGFVRNKKANAQRMEA